MYCVKENGLGIDEWHLSRIWGAFYRVDPKMSEPGEGLGLSVIQRIAEMHRGKVWVESVPNEGSSFYFELPKNLV